MILLLIIGACLFIYAFVQIVRAVFKLALAVYYRKLASENQVDEGFKKHVLKEKNDYKRFEKNLDNKLRRGI